MKQAKPKAVKSFVGDIPAQPTNQIISNQMPPYEESGVKFMGYARKLGANGQWELKKQYPWSFVYDVQDPVYGNAYPVIKTYTNQGFQLFITDILIQHNAMNIASIGNLELYDDYGKTIPIKIFSYQMPFSFNNLASMPYHFDPPLGQMPNHFDQYYHMCASPGNVCIIQYFGYWEEL